MDTLMSAPRRWRASRRFEASIAFDDLGVTERRAPGETLRLIWADLVLVTVVTTHHGPGEDLFVVLRPREGEPVVVPHSDTTPAFLDRLFALPGFDEARFYSSMRSSDERSFVCWRA